MATLNIDAVKSSGGFKGGLHKREIEWHNDEGETLKFDVYVKPLSYAAAVNTVDSKTPQEDKIARNIANSICDEEGNPIFEPGDITGESGKFEGPLDAGLTIALLAAIGEVSNMGKAKAKQKSLPTKKSSGTS